MSNASPTPAQWPDLERYTCRIVLPPRAPHLNAWPKAQEAERRLEWLRWAESINDPRTPEHRILLDDCLSAFLLTYEACFQFADDQIGKARGKQAFSLWLKAHALHDLSVRGVRTLRHFAAHVEMKPASRAISLVIGGSLPDGRSATTVSTRWRLPHISADDLRKLSRPRIAVEELPEWHRLVESQDAQTLLAGALGKLNSLLTDAELLA